MSDTDSFIEEVTEEVRRDRLFNVMRKYAWVAVLAIVLIVGGAAWSEFTKARTQAAAAALGDAISQALTNDDPAARAEALAQVTTDDPGGAAIVAFLQATALSASGETQAAVAALDGIALSGDLPQIYRDVASFKALTLQAAADPPAEAEVLRAGFETLAAPGNRLRLLAQEQLALLDMRAGDPQAAIDRLQTILDDAEVTPDLQQRASQVIVALGGEPRERDAGSQG